MRENVKTIVASIDDVAKRIDTFLAERDIFLSRSAAQKAIDGDMILVNGKTVKSGLRLKPQDTITIMAAEIERENSINPENISLDIVYEDKSILVINKPVGMVVHPGSGIRAGTLVNALLYRYGNKLPSVTSDTSIRPGIVHRLDKETSGLMVVALTENAHRALTRQFSDRKVEKTYNAIVWGRVENDSVISAAIKRDPVNPLRMCVRDDGREAVTAIKVIRSSSYASLLQLSPKTGRTHQIRVHMTHAGHPLLGDSLYGGEKDIWLKRVDPMFRQNAAKLAKESKRVMLHASKLSFLHPANKKRVTLESSLPDDFKRAEQWVI